MIICIKKLYNCILIQVTVFAEFRKCLGCKAVMLGKLYYVTRKNTTFGDCGEGGN